MLFYAMTVSDLSERYSERQSVRQRRSDDGGGVHCGKGSETQKRGFFRLDRGGCFASFAKNVLAFDFLVFQKISGG